MRLFCFPYASGRALIYRSWLNSFPIHIEVVPVELPGRGTRISEPLFRRLSPLLSSLTAAMEPYLDRPFALFGHSLGGLLGFELARTLLEQRNLRPEHLFISGCRAPQMPSAVSDTYNLPHDEFIERIRHLDGTPAEVLETPELLELLLPILRADFELYDTYQFESLPLLTCPISAFGGLKDIIVSPEQLDGWKVHTTGPFNRRMFPGGHFYIHTDEIPLLSMIVQTLVS